MLCVVMPGLYESGLVCMSLVCLFGSSVCYVRVVYNGTERWRKAAHQFSNQQRGQGFNGG
jgi:hypothetical protein